jgi:hypothetical protein
MRISDYPMEISDWYGDEVAATYDDDTAGHGAAGTSSSRPLLARLGWELEDRDLTA